MEKKKEKDFLGYIKVDIEKTDLFNYGSPENYMNQLFYENIKKNVENRTMPCFSDTAQEQVREVTSRKLIGGMNEVMMQQDMAAHGFKSGMYISASEMLKITGGDRSKIEIMNGYKPVLVKDFVNNIETNQFRTGDTRFQFMYNIDAFSDSTREKIKEHIEKCKETNREECAEHLKNHKENISKTQNFQLTAGETERRNSSRERMQKITKTNPDMKELVLYSVAAQTASYTGQKVAVSATQETKDKAYSHFDNLVLKVNRGDLSRLDMAADFGKAVNAANSYAKLQASKDFSLEHEKLRVENQQKKLNQERSRGRPSWER